LSYFPCLQLESERRKKRRRKRRSRRIKGRGKGSRGRRSMKFHVTEVLELFAH
jgi:hypothetical protein